MAPKTPWISRFLRYPFDAGSAADKRPRKGKEARLSSTGFRLPAALAATLLAPAAWAADPPPQVPAIQPGSANTPAASANTDQKTWPPGVQVLSPSAPLGPKERHGMALVHRWQGRHVMPAMGPRGEVRFLYGATMPTVVCAPLEITNIALQPGEIVQKLDLGDPTMWTVEPGISGTGMNQITHLLIKPADAGLVTTIDVETSRRTYAIRLSSTQRDYMPLVAFDYPSDQADLWAAYQQATAAQSMAPRPNAGSYLMYQIGGDNPPWRPIVVYSDGQKTYLEFAPAMAYGTAPVLEKLNGGGFFSGPSTEVVNYRTYTDPERGIFYIYDGVLERAELISGVGGDQTRVYLTRIGG
jgi:type IV secretion system protein TrbG